MLGFFNFLVSIVCRGLEAYHLLLTDMKCNLIITESKGDGTIDAEDSEDDWTFSDYRHPETSKEENVTNNEVADSSAGLEVRDHSVNLC